MAESEYLVGHLTLKEKMKDPEFRKQWIEKSRKGALTTKNRYQFTLEDQSKGGKACKHRTPPDRKHFYLLEKTKINEIAPQFDCIFNPKVCDAIAFKDGKIYFIEIKCGQGYLNKNQRKFKDLVSKTQADFVLIHIG